MKARKSGLKSTSKQGLEIAVPNELKYKYNMLPEFAKTSASIRKTIAT